MADTVDLKTQDRIALYIGRLVIQNEALTEQLLALKERPAEKEAAAPKSKISTVY